MAEIRFLGTGAAVPSERVQSGVLVDDILVDCGSGVLHRLGQAEREDDATSFDEIEDILVSHTHIDHVSDIPALMKADWIVGKTSLTIHGPPGTRETVESLLDAYDYMKGRIDLEIEEIQPGESFKAGGRQIETYETSHTDESMGFRIGDVVYTGDTEVIDETVEFSEGCDLLIHECAFPDGVDVTGHSRPSDIAEIAPDLDVGEIYLTHLYPQTRGKERKMRRKVADEFNGDVSIPDDGESLTV
ncbi:MBL fold metallo-hydrolase [Halorutilales archaeon Cl-col2-1]